jgi:hypothetical protein
MEEKNNEEKTVHIFYQEEDKAGGKTIPDRQRHN